MSKRERRMLRNGMRSIRRGVCIVELETNVVHVAMRERTFYDDPNVMAYAACGWKIRFGEYRGSKGPTTCILCVVRGV